MLGSSWLDLVTVGSSSAEAPSRGQDHFPRLSPSGRRLSLLERLDDNRAEPCSFGPGLRHGDEWIRHFEGTREKLSQLFSIPSGCAGSQGRLELLRSEACKAFPVKFRDARPVPLQAKGAGLSRAPGEGQIWPPV